MISVEAIQIWNYIDYYWQRDGQLPEIQHLYIGEDRMTITNMPC